MREPQTLAYLSATDTVISGTMPLQQAPIVQGNLKFPIGWSNGWPHTWTSEAHHLVNEFRAVISTEIPKRNPEFEAHLNSIYTCNKLAVEQTKWNKKKSGKGEEIWRRSSSN